MGKHLGAVSALHGVNLTVRSGEAVAAIAPKAAGKSTVFKPITDSEPARADHAGAFPHA